MEFVQHYLIQLFSRVSNFLLTSKWQRLVWGAYLIGFFSLPGWPAQVTLYWEPQPDSTAVGFNVYCRPENGPFQLVKDAGDQTFATVSGLETGKTYFFAVKAYNIYGHEGDFSDEGRVYRSCTRHPDSHEQTSGRADVNSYSTGHAGRHGDPHTSSYRYTIAIPYRDGSPGADGYTDGHGYVNIHTNGCADGHAGPDGHTDCHGDSHTGSYSYPIALTHGNRNPGTDGYGYADGYGDPDGHPNS